MTKRMIIEPITVARLTDDSVDALRIMEEAGFNIANQVSAYRERIFRWVWENTDEDKRDRLYELIDHRWASPMTVHYDIDVEKLSVDAFPPVLACWIGDHGPGQLVAGGPEWERRNLMQRLVTEYEAEHGADQPV